MVKLGDGIACPIPTCPSTFSPQNVRGFLLGPRLTADFKKLSDIGPDEPDRGKGGGQCVALIYLLSLYRTLLVTKTLLVVPCNTALRTTELGLRVGMLRTPHLDKGQLWSFVLCKELQS